MIFHEIYGNYYRTVAEILDAALKEEISDKTIYVIKKSECPDIITMTARLSRSIADTLRDHLTYMESFEHIIVYYDNGQLELTRILTSVFNALFFHVEFRKVKPIDYKLFQVADLICTMRLLSKKAESNSFSRSETEFFGSVRDFKKNYWKILSKKQL